MTSDSHHGPRSLPRCARHWLAVGALLLGGVKAWGASAGEVYRQRVESVRQVPGLAAFWDFVEREDGVGGTGRFLAYTSTGDEHRYVLEPHNISLDYWHEGEPATQADFPLLGRGPFGQAVHFQTKTAEDLSSLPVLEIPREKLHDTPLDVKGPGRSVSMVVWLIHEEGNHALAGIWSEGTITERGMPAVVREQGARQYALFAGMGANPGGVGVHVSDNGLGSFGDHYARHLAVAPGNLTHVKATASAAELDAGWSVAGMVFDCGARTITAYLNGVAEDRWVESPAKNRFYKAAARAWQQSRLARIPGQQPGEDPAFPSDQYYAPPESVALQEKVEVESADERTVLRTYGFTRVRVTLRRDGTGAWTEVGEAELAALRTNPYWFGHDLYAPATVADGGPFTIGRVLHSGRLGSLTAYLGGVAVYGRALAPSEMHALARVGYDESSPNDKLAILRCADFLDELARK